ncbi:MAG TPA: chemotaxis protein CheC [Methanolinea sp.]|jgi:chemotaxis protein CheC|nr:MAG: flagellar motor switch protein [Methanoregulaceae archaeon PtaB.Bin009]OPY41438.1 MAG: flagellar motor switch protein [Methanoregulaceae archaeon PtaU1.Bin066]HII76591.1 chemotaxis protein CheC [Methanolinea sp.]HNQ30064.1 chemotaxis protein CheC [Methanolinea sp.]HNS83080.1 chemotaxis protein CheC [Methanolinea sp.]
MLNSHQRDALRELGNIGAAHAATTLSTMLMSNIEMEVPEISVVDIAKIHEHVGDELSALVIFQITGEVSGGGYLLLHIPKNSVIRLTNAMLGMTDLERDLTEMDESALLEIGNIMVSAFLDATATLLSIIMLPSPPSMIIDMPHAAFQTILAMQEFSEIDQVVIFRTELRSDQHKISSNLFLLPNKPMLDEILSMLENLMK